MKQTITGNPKIILLTALILYALVFLVSCFSFKIHPSLFPYITYLSLGFPFLFAGYVCIAIPVVYYFFRKQLWIAFLILLPSFNSVAAVFSFHLPHRFQTAKQKGQIRILSWNVNAFLYKPYEVLDVKESAKQAAMVDFIKEMQADILCFQDFAEAPEMYGKVNVSYIADSLHYPYHYFSEDGANYGTIIFSRLPVIDSGRTKYTERKYPESIAYVDIIAGKDTFRVYNTHLRSMNLHQEIITPENIGYLEFVKEDTAVLFHVSRFQRLEYFDVIHASQAQIVKKTLNATQLPFVFCADLNAVPSSYVYHHIQNGSTDALLAKGSGLSGTYHKFTPALRIDVLLMNNSVHPTQFYAPKPDLSDHYPLVTDIQLHN
jgi:endonuclease/exonuclease/phosphatase family metal-dependent hydrolase